MGDEGGFSATYANGRKLNGDEIYDNAGNLVSKRTATNTYDGWGFDASGRNVGTVMAWDESLQRRQDTISNLLDGDGRAVKRVDLKETWVRTTPPEYVSSTKTEYYIRSSVLGGKVLTELREDGTKMQTNVYTGDAVIAEQMSFPADAQHSTEWGYVIWKHEDPVTGSYNRKRANGSSPTGSEPLPNAELEPLGGKIPDADPYDPDIPPPAGLRDFRYNGGDVFRPEYGCIVDGFVQDGPAACTQMLMNGSGVQCPNNNCGPVRVRFNGQTILAPFRAYADGYEGYVPPNGRYIGKGVLRPIGPSVPGTLRRGDTNFSLLNRSGDPESDLRFAGSFQAFFIWEMFQQYGDDMFSVKIADTASAEKLMRAVFDANPGCEEALNKILKEMGAVAGDRNPNIAAGISGVFADIREQAVGGFRFNTSGRQAQDEFTQTTGSSARVPGGGGLSWRTNPMQGFDAYVHVHGYYTQADNTGMGVMYLLFGRLVHEIAHVSGARNTYGHDSEPPFNEMTVAAQRLGATDFDAYLRKYCNPANLRP